MGCWNETCGITQVPIMHNDPVVLILLANVAQHRSADRMDGHSGHCYSNDVWSPFALPIYGIYNDYGSIEDVTEGWNTEWIINSLKKYMIEKPLGSNKYHDVAISKNDLSIENLLDWIHESRVEVKGIRENNPLGFMMVHAWAWEHLSNGKPTWNDDDPLEKVIQDGREYYLAMQKLAATSEQDNSLAQWRRSNGNVIDDHHNAFYALGESGCRLDSYSMVRYGIRPYHKLFDAYAMAGHSVDDGLVMDLITEMSKYLCFHTNMEALRKTYMPQAGKGHQNQDYDRFIRLNEVANKWMRKRQDEWNAEYGDSEENEEVA